MSLLRRIFKARSTAFKEKTVKVIVLGLENSGKTSIVQFLSGKYLACTSPSKGYTISTVHARGHDIRLWDFAGASHCRAFWKKYFAHTDILWLHITLHAEELRGVPVLIYVSKSDRVAPLQEYDVIKACRLRCCDGRAWLSQACSVVTGKGVQNGFKRILEKLEAKI